MTTDRNLPSKPKLNEDEDRYLRILNMLGRRYSPDPTDHSHHDVNVRITEPMPADPVQKVYGNFVDEDIERTELE